MQSRSHLVTGLRARTYDYSGPVWNRIKAAHLSLVNPLPGQRVLDVGCGTGRMLAQLAETSPPDVELYGIEPSADMWERAKARGYVRNVQLKKGFAQELPYPAGQFDVVISTQVLHHLPTTEKERAIQEMHRVLKPGGTIVVSDWGRPTSFVGRCFGLLWRNHAYVRENVPLLSATTFRRFGFIKSVTEHVQFGVVHHIRASKGC